MYFSILFAALLVVGALASPIDQQKRDMEVRVEYVTHIHWVYVDGAQTSTSTQINRGYNAYYHKDRPVNSVISTTTTSFVSALPASTTREALLIQAPSSSVASVVVSTPVVTGSAAVVTSSAAAEAPVPQQGGTTSPKTLVPDLDVESPVYAAISVDHHNVHRRNHSAPDVVYDQTLAKWAQAKAKSCVWNEDLPPGATNVGMNIAQGTWVGAGNLSVVISNMWYNQELPQFPAYGVADLDTNGKAFQGWGHFSQVVWPDTKAIGCGSSPCDASTSISSGYFSVCLYSPPGNYLGQFNKVGRPQGLPSVGVDGNNIFGL